MLAFLENSWNNVSTFHRSPIPANITYKVEKQLENLSLFLHMDWRAKTLKYYVDRFPGMPNSMLSWKTVKPCQLSVLLPLNMLLKCSLSLKKKVCTQDTRVWCMLLKYLVFGLSIFWQGHTALWNKTILLLVC